MIEINKSVTIISVNGASFFAQSLKTSFESKEYDVCFLNLFEVDVSKLESNERRLVFLFADEYNDLNSRLLSSVKNFIINNNYRIVILGGNDEIEFVKRTIPLSKILDVYYKPFDYKKIIEKTQDYLSIICYEDIKKKILVVDDSSVMLRTINSWLEEEYQVALANSAQRAFAQIEKEIPDLILLDYEMPECSGIEFLKQLREDPEKKHIPVIFLTSKDDGDIVKNALSLRPEGYLLKTIPSDEILNKIAKFFEGRAIKMSKQ